LLRERPAAKLRVRERLTRELIDGLAAGELDILIARIPELKDPAIFMQPLFNDRLFIVADAGHPLQGQASLGLSDLVDQEWLLPGSHILLRQEIDAAFRASGLPVPIVRAETDFGSASMLRLIPGTRMLSVCGAESLGRIEGLCALNVASDRLQLHRQIGFLYRKGGYLSPLTRRFIDLIFEHALAFAKPSQ
jgi:DNA-binding transcriptional LysR family regulator